MSNLRKKRNKRSLGILLPVFFVFGLFVSFFTIIPFVFGATINLGIDNLSVSYDNGTWTKSGTSLIGEAAGKDGTSGCNSTPASNLTSTLTFKATVAGDLSFDYSAPVRTGTGGSFKIGSTTITSSGSHSVSLAANGTLACVLYSGNAGASNKMSVTLSNISFVTNTNVTITFALPVGPGTYTKDKVAVTTQTSVTAPGSTTYNLVATPNSNARFFAWYKDGAILSKSLSLSFKSGSDCTIYPQFFEGSNSPIFQISSNLQFGTSGDKYESNLKTAIDYAKSNSKKYIILSESGTIYPLIEEGVNKDYEIPSSITFMIPFDESHTAFSNYAEPASDEGTYTKPTEFIRLTLAEGTSISTSGIIHLPCKMSIKGQNSENPLSGGTNGAPSGPYGCIYLNSDSTIKLKSGSKLYCWGFIRGEGTVEALSGSTVYEYFQIRDFRGGSHTSNVLDHAFPFNQYYVQNVEANLKLCSGSEEIVRTGLSYNAPFFGMQYTKVNIPFIGTSGMFRFNDSTGYIIKKYNGALDRLEFSVYGNCYLSNMAINISGVMNVQTQDYNLPLNNNISIYIKSGSTATVSNQSFILLTGTELVVEEDATLNIDGSSKIILFDYDDYHGKSISGGNASNDTLPVAFAPGSATTRTRNPGDAKLLVNGSVYVTGDLYTTNGGADICSTIDAPGKITYAFTSTKNASITFEENNGTVKSSDGDPTHDINANMASLINGNGTYESIKTVYTDSNTDKSLEHDFEYIAGTAKWNGHESDGLKYRMTFVDPRYPNFKVKYPEDDEDKLIVSGEPFRFPTKTEFLEYIDTYYKSDQYYNANAFNSDKEILMWTTGGNYYKAGVMTEGKIGYKKTDVNPFFGGWMVEIDSQENEQRRYLLESQTLTYNYAVGLLKTETYFSGGGQSIFLFTTDGYLDVGTSGLFYYDSNVYPYGDNQYYLLDEGIVRDIHGLNIIDLNYYYVGEDNHPLMNGTYYLSEFGTFTDFEPGYYYFDEYGIMSTIPVQKQKPTFIDNGVAYVTYDTEAADNYGLFAYNNNLYYAGANGILVVSTSFYVSSEMINGCTIGGIGVEEGLYYFDKQGRMYDSSLNLITNGGQTV